MFDLQPIKVSYTLSLLIFLGIAQKRRKSEKRSKKGHFWPFFRPSGGPFSGNRDMPDMRPMPFDSQQSVLPPQRV